MTTTPFPFADLAEGGPATMRDQARGRTDPCGDMAFKPFGMDPEATSEPERRYTEDDLTRAVDEARRRAAEETETELRRAMADDLENRRVELLATINDQLDRHRAAFDQELRRLAEVSHALALALSEALIPRALEAQPLADIADVLKATLARLAKEPSIELRLPPDLVDVGELAFAEIAAETGYSGEVATIADAALGPGDAALRWKGGAIERSASRLGSEARDIVEHWLQDASQADEPEDTMGDTTPAETLPPCMPADGTSASETDHERVMP